MRDPTVKRVSMIEKDVYISIESGFSKDQMGYTSRINIVRKRKDIDEDTTAKIIGAIMEILDTTNHEGE